MRLTIPRTGFLPIGFPLPRFFEVRLPRPTRAARPHAAVICSGAKKPGDHSGQPFGVKAKAPRDHGRPGMGGGNGSAPRPGSGATAVAPWLASSRVSG